MYFKLWFVYQTVFFSSIVDSMQKWNSSKVFCIIYGSTTWIAVPLLLCVYFLLFILYREEHMVLHILLTSNNKNRKSSFTFSRAAEQKKNKLSIDGWFLIACQKMRNRIDSRFWASWHLNAAKVKSFMKICWTLEIDCVWQHFNIPFGRLLLLLLLSSLIAAAFAFLGVEFSHS